jgi:hypothetical protein
MAAYKCAHCVVRWPAEGKRFGRCPGCGEPTAWVNARPSPPDELFDVFYRGRGPREVEIDWDRVLPGLDEIRDLERIPTLESHPRTEEG